MMYHTFISGEQATELIIIKLLYELYTKKQSNFNTFLFGEQAIDLNINKLLYETCAKEKKTQQQMIKMQVYKEKYYV